LTNSTLFWGFEVNDLELRFDGKEISLMALVYMFDWWISK